MMTRDPPARGATRPGSTATSGCPSCGSTEIIEITLALLDGRVSFRHCNRCEWREWERDRRGIRIDEVLKQVPPAPRGRKR